ncbi:Uncharacterised protein [Chlamydia trachomatis]|nr:Uncharacterised protein [Chlamydia trachomatis]
MTFYSIVNNALSANHTDIDIDIGIRYPFRVDETFEEKVEANRFYFSNPQKEKHDRARSRASTGANRNPMIFCPVNNIPDNEQVIAHPFGDNNRGFQFETFFNQRKRVFPREFLCNVS